MGIALQAVANEAGAKIRVGKEREPFPFPQIVLIDPERVLVGSEKDEYSLKLYQGSEALTEKALGLHAFTGQVIGLLNNSESLKGILGVSQVVEVGGFEEACEIFPKGPISLEAFDFSQYNAEGFPLMHFGLRWSDIYSLPVCRLEFYPHAKYLPPLSSKAPQVMLREARIGERHAPISYRFPSFPPGTGRLDAEGWHRSFFAFLRYSPSEEFRISQEAVEVIDGYLQGLDLETGEIRVPA